MKRFSWTMKQKKKYVLKIKFNNKIKIKKLIKTLTNTMNNQFF